MAITTIEIRGNPPIGCMVVQHPGESAPSTLYPGTTWSNVSANFAGSFFRAEGGLAKAYGGGKQDFAFQGHYHAGENRGLEASGGSTACLVPVGNGGSVATVTSPPTTDNVNGAPKTAAETRPDNFTVRIWQRTA